jgi:CRP-like cAMP-binding protein
MNKLSRADAAPWAARGSMFSQPGLARPVAWDTPRDLDRLRAGHARGRPGKPLVPTSVASPRLGDELFARLLAYGTPQETHPGDVLFTPGDEDVDLIVVDRGSAEVVRTETADVPAAIVAVVDAGGFVGELNLLTGQNVYLSSEPSWLAPARRSSSTPTGTATCSACTCRAGKSLTARPLSSRPGPATGRCRWNAGPTSRAPVSTTRPPN